MIKVVTLSHDWTPFLALLETFLWLTLIVIHDSDTGKTVVLGHLFSSVELPRRGDDEGVSESILLLISDLQTGSSFFIYSGIWALGVHTGCRDREDKTING